MLSFRLDQSYNIKGVELRLILSNLESNPDYVRGILEEIIMRDFEEKGTINRRPKRDLKVLKSTGEKKHRDSFEVRLAKLQNELNSIKAQRTSMGTLRGR